MVRQGGIRKAAGSLHVTPQAVSSAIRNLERELRVDVLMRDGQEVRPTKAGIAIAERAEDILRSVDDLKRIGSVETEGFSEGAHYRLYIPGLSGRGDLFTDEMYECFSRENPHLHLDVWGQSSDSCEDALLLGLADSALTFQKSCNAGIESRELGDVPLRLLVSAEGDLGALDEVPICDLSYRLLAMPINLSAILNVLKTFDDIDVEKLKYRNTGFGFNDQLEFLENGGVMLVLPNAPLVQAGRNVALLKFLASERPALTLYFCNKRETWNEEHQRMYWFLVDSLKALFH